MGNRNSGPKSTDSYTYNSGNEQLSYKGKILLLDTNDQNEYDLNGNLIKKTQTEGKLQTITNYAYDDENRLIYVKIQRGDKIKEVSFSYDPFGRRISQALERDDFEISLIKPIYPQITKYVYDNQNILAEYDQNNKQIASYIHGPNIDEPLSAEIRNTRIYYHADGLGSITALTNHMGMTIQRYDYDAFGNIKCTPFPQWIKQPYMFTGREFDSETGLYYYRTRYYDPKVGRFVTRDPVGFGAGDYNLYNYVGANPVNYTDPEGLELISSQEGLKIIAAGEKYIGTRYSVMDCSHFVNSAYTAAGFPYEYYPYGPTYNFARNPKFKQVANCQAGDVALFIGHMGIYNPNPPKSGYNILSATIKKGVIYGKASWFLGGYRCYRYDKCQNN